MNETQRESTERAEILLRISEARSSEGLGTDSEVVDHLTVLDILTDLRHYCHTHEIPWDDVLREAWEHWRKESINE
jgi:hypothetical protein